MTVTAFLWLVLRQRETLPAERRIPLSLIRLSASFREVFTNRIAMGYTIMAGLVLGALFRGPTPAVGVNGVSAGVVLLHRYSVR
jgi:hypothetical protein